MRLRPDSAVNPELGRNIHILSGHPRLDFVRDHYKPGVCLDIGAGQGAFSIWLQRQGGNTVCMLDICEFPACPEGIECMQADFTKLPHESLFDAFDTILMMEFLEHLADPLAAVRKCYDLLRPGGKLLITTPFTDAWDYEHDHIWRFDVADIVRILVSSTLRPKTYVPEVWHDDTFIYAVVTRKE